MPLADTRFLQRRRALASALAAQRIDAMLVTSLINVRYLSGFSGSNAALIVRKDLSASIATDGRYTTQIAEEVPDLEAKIERDCAKALLAEVEGPRRVGFESAHLTVADRDRLEATLGEDVTLVPVTGVLEAIRMKKDAVERQRLAEVATLANTAFQEMLDAGVVAAGQTELAIAADLEYRMRKAGAERPSFDTIVASGPNSAKPHHSATERVLEPGDLVTIDFGAHWRGFNSDTTRTVVVGKADSWTKEIYEVVLQAQLAGCEAATPGTALADVDRACRDLITEAGYGEYFVHSTGHGVGLEVHEAPGAAQRSTGVLEEHMTLTIEPGIYVPGRGGVRIEDTLIIGAGRPTNLTDLPKDLLEL